MQSLTQQITLFRHRDSVNPDLVCDRILSRGVIQLIQRQPLYGILLAKLTRISNHKLTAPLGLGWLHNHLVMNYQPSYCRQQIKTGSELLFWLEHEALHIIWLHPVRYPKTNYVTQIATDIAVNQLIPNRINGEISLQAINHRYGLQMPSDVNSQVYVDQLTQYFSRQRRRTGQKRTIVNRRIKRILKNRSDDHGLWGSDQHLSHQAKASEIIRLLQRSYRNVGAKARGTLPGKVHNQLKRITANDVIDWRAYIRMGLGNVPFARKPSRSRFNRRQAYRMDLMGSVSNYIQSVSIFIDNSGSMGDAEISYLLAQLGNFLKHFPVNVNVYSFDTVVHAEHRYSANNFHQLQFVRVGGGGTRFQSIFDYCHRYLQPNQLIIILTDGYGEARLRYYNFNNLLWILTTPKDQFSVKNRRGHLVSLANQAGLRDLK